MDKFCGEVGFLTTVETAPDVFEEQIEERLYYGDVMRLSNRWQNGESLNDDISINKQISILSDPFAEQNFFRIKYVKWMGSLWKVSSAEPQRPRLILTLGGVYNGPAN